MACRTMHLSGGGYAIVCGPFLPAPCRSGAAVMSQKVYNGRHAQSVSHDMSQSAILTLS